MFGSLSPPPMTRLRPIIGLVAAVILVLSSVAHSIVGWRAMRAQLAGSRAPANLVTGLGIGWHFAGAAMLALGIILLYVFIGRQQRVQRSRFPAQVIGVLYLAFGMYAYLMTRGDFFLAAFIVPGVLIALASFGADGVDG